MDDARSTTTQAGTINGMPTPLTATILELTDLLPELDRRRLAKAITGPAPVLGYEEGYAVLVKAAADLDDLATQLLTDINTPAPS